MVTWSDIQDKWSAPKLGHVADELAHAKKQLSSLSDEANSLRAECWTGQSAMAAEAAARSISHALNSYALQISSTQKGLQRAQPEVSTLVKDVDAVITDATSAGLKIDIDGTVTAPSPVNANDYVIGGQLDPVSFSAAKAAQANLVDRYQFQVNALLTRADTLDREVEGLLLTAIGQVAPAGSTLSEALTDGQHLPPLPARGASATEVRDWWDGLPKADKDWLVEHESQLIGNLNGVPAVMRDKANRLTNEREVNDFADLFRSRGLKPPSDADELKKWQHSALHGRPHPELTELLSDRSFVERYAGAMSIRDEVEKGKYEFFDEALRKPVSVPRLLYAYDTAAFDGQGRAAIAYGNPDTAHNVAVSVPGLESRVTNIDNLAGDAAQLYQESYFADRGHQTSTIAWQGYNAPEWGSSVLTHGRADAGAPSLAEDMAALHDTLKNKGKLTVVAHSYGSTMTADALQNTSMAKSVDQVILIGNPGVGTMHSVSDMHLREGQLFVGSASNDRVTTLVDGLGNDPASDQFDGEVRFKAESVDRGKGTLFGDHSRYYQPDSESLSNMADIVTGQADQLAQSGMLAPERLSAPSPYGVWTVDAESGRAPTGDHHR